MGCFPRIGCLLSLAVLAAVGAWWYGDRFPVVAGRVAAKAAGTVAKAAEDAGARLTAADSARRAAEALRRWVPLAAPSARPGGALVRLGRRGGPAYVSVGADSLAVALGPALAAMLPSGLVTDRALALQGERLYLRGVVERSDLLGAGALASLLGGVVEGRDTLLLEGGLTLARPGVLVYKVRAIRLGAVAVPDPLHPAVLVRLRQEAPGDGRDSAAGPPLPEDALPLRIPAAVADVRIADGRVVFYRAVPR